MKVKGSIEIILVFLVLIILSIVFIFNKLLDENQNCRNYFSGSLKLNNNLSAVVYNEGCILFDKKNQKQVDYISINQIEDIMKSEHAQVEKIKYLIDNSK